MATISLNKLSLLATLPLLLSACEESDPIQYGGTQPLTTPVISLDSAAFDALSFSWTAVEGAVEYCFRFSDKQGNLIGGELTNDTWVEVEGLTCSTEYQLSVLAYADVQSQYTTSAEGTLTVKTPFYPLVDVEGLYTPALLSNTWEATLVETRAEGEEDHFGTFTLQSWYSHDGYDLEFKVNADGTTITILNGTLDEASGWIKVMAGPSTGIKTNQYVRQGVLIDVSRCSFDYAAQQLKIYSRSTKDAKREGFDLFVWE